MTLGHSRNAGLTRPAYGEAQVAASFAAIGAP
jgi:hypothetical protein